MQSVIVTGYYNDNLTFYFLGGINVPNIIDIIHWPVVLSPVHYCLFQWLYCHQNHED